MYGIITVIVGANRWLLVYMNLSELESFYVLKKKNVWILTVYTIMSHIIWQHQDNNYSF